MSTKTFLITISVVLLSINTFAQSIAARISEHCFEYLDAPVRTVGAENMPAVPLNSVLEATMIPSAAKVAAAMRLLLDY